MRSRSAYDCRSLFQCDQRRDRLAQSRSLGFPHFPRGDVLDLTRDVSRPATNCCPLFWVISHWVKSALHYSGVVLSASGDEEHQRGHQCSNPLPAWQAVPFSLQEAFRRESSNMRVVPAKRPTRMAQMLSASMALAQTCQARTRSMSRAAGEA